MSGFETESSSGASRKKANILVTGTPGTGKTTTAEQVAEKLGFRNVNVGQLVKDNNCYEEHDDTFDTYLINDGDEDKLLDLMEPMLKEGGCVVDFHSPELFPERWFDLVLVLRTDTEILYDRLTQRGYSDKKRNENMECEIMQVIIEETREAYDENIVHELPSNNIEDLESNVNRAHQWHEAFKANSA